jgi:hypothetical protein
MPSEEDDAGASSYDAPVKSMGRHSSREGLEKMHPQEIKNANRNPDFDRILGDIGIRIL